VNGKKRVDKDETAAAAFTGVFVVNPNINW